MRHTPLPRIVGLALVACSLAHLAGCGKKEAPAPPSAAVSVSADDSAKTDVTPVGDVATDSSEYKLVIPLGLPSLAIPEDNPMTAEKIELGKLLYFDTRLSKDGTISCATCHDPTLGWAERRPTSEGIGHELGNRNSPTVINAAYAPVQFWDGRAASLEEQALGPIENPIEMGHALHILVDELNAIPGYKERFQAVFGTDVTEEGIAKAIAAFERTILSGNSPYDRFVAGDDAALTDAQRRGMDLFDEHCAVCHTPPLFSNYSFINTGIGMTADEPDPGRMEATGNERDFGRFRVPMLRDIVDTPPYFHDGSAETLEIAVAVMAQGGVDHPLRSALMKAVGSANLSEADQEDIVAFMHALSGEYPIVDPPQLP